MATSGPVGGFIVPGIPHPLLVPEQNEGWQRLREGFERARAEIARLEPDLILIYSTMWPSVIGHQIQADPNPRWTHVDELFHDLGSIPYSFRIDASFAEAYRAAAQARGLEARTVAYHGFPIDTGSVVALKLLNPDDTFPACIVSSNVYADRAETLVLAKAGRDALKAQGKRAVVVVVGTLSNRLFTDFIDPAEDHVHSPKDEEWNRKLLEFFDEGRLEDVAQLSREIHSQIRVHKVVNFKSMWWLAGIMGQHNRYEGDVYAYEALYGTGAAVVSLIPSAAGIGDKEFDEDDVEVFRGDRNVIAGAEVVASTPTAEPTDAPPPNPARARPRPLSTNPVNVAGAPKPVGAYPHARRVGDLIYLSGVGPRDPVTNEVPGGPIRDDVGPLPYDIRKQTRAALDNVRTILEGAGTSQRRAIAAAADACPVNL